MTMRKFAGLSAIAAAAAVAPISFDADQGVFRLRQACGQARECVAAANYICSTAHADHKEYRCSKGCMESET